MECFSDGNDKGLGAEIEVGVESPGSVEQKLVGTLVAASDRRENGTRELSKKGSYAIFRISVPDNYAVQSGSASCPESCRKECITFRGCSEHESYCTMD